MTDFRNLVADQQDLRIKLAHIMGKKGFSFDRLADEMGMPYHSVRRFLKGTVKARMKTLYKINEYVKQQNEESKQ